MKKILNAYLNKWWLPALIYLCLMSVDATISLLRWQLTKATYNTLTNVEIVSIASMLFGLLYLLYKQSWRKAFLSLLLIIVCAGVTIVIIGLQFGAPALILDEDHFADDLSIPDNLDISLPETNVSHFSPVSSTTEEDGFQQAIRTALTTKGNDNVELIPSIPALRSVTSNYFNVFKAYLDASPDWHVFTEQGSLFASRRWSYNGVPKNTLHGYVSDFGGDSKFQTRALLCLDKKQWSTYEVQKTEEGLVPFSPKLSKGNDLLESFIMIDSGAVWLEIFEQSGNPERRITKATLVYLEKEFAEFNLAPQAALTTARNQSKSFAKELVDTENLHVLRLENGSQPGIYTVVYSLNPQEAGWVYLKAYEVTNNTPLSESRLKGSSMTRSTWSDNTDERFGSKAGFTIYEGDWGKPYAARFEVWFIPDSGEIERKLGERNYKIEGWQR